MRAFFEQINKETNEYKVYIKSNAICDTERAIFVKGQHEAFMVCSLINELITYFEENKIKEDQACLLKFDIKKEKKEMEPYLKYCICPICKFDSDYHPFINPDNISHLLKYIGPKTIISYYGIDIQGPHFKRTCINCGYEWPQSIVKEK